jgi:molybdate transport system regulatory protein
MARIRLRIYLGAAESKLGPGKVELLEAIRRHGSISAAARSMGMAYRHAWNLVNDLNRSLGAPAVVRSVGGRRGGGAALTPLGEEIVARFRRLERATQRALRRDLADLEAMLPKERRRRRPQAHRGA